MENSKKNNKIRAYVILDNYSWLAISHDINEFAQILHTYLHTMSISEKENTYSIKNVFIDEKEYISVRKKFEESAIEYLKIEEETVEKRIKSKNEENIKSKNEKREWSNVTIDPKYIKCKKDHLTLLEFNNE